MRVRIEMEGGRFSGLVMPAVRGGDRECNRGLRRLAGPSIMGSLKADREAGRADRGGDPRDVVSPVLPAGFQRQDDALIGPPPAPDAPRAAVVRSN